SGHLNGVIRGFRLDPVVTIPPSTETTARPGPRPNGWSNTNTTISMHATDRSGSGVKQIQFSLSGAQTLSLQTVAGSDASTTIVAEGTTTLTYFATDNAGNVEPLQSLNTSIDKTAPAISGMPGAGCNLWPPNGTMVKVAT